MDELDKLKLRLEQMETRIRALEREARDREYRYKQELKALKETLNRK